MSRDESELFANQSNYLHISAMHIKNLKTFVIPIKMCNFIRLNQFLSLFDKWLWIATHCNDLQTTAINAIQSNKIKSIAKIFNVLQFKPNEFKQRFHPFFETIGIIWSLLATRFCAWCPNTIALLQMNVTCKKWYLIYS